jgi:cholesterol transport system auxiliary component
MSATTIRAMNVTNRLHAVARALGVLVLATFVGGCTALKPAEVDNPNLHLLDAKSVAIVPEKRDLVLEVSAPRAWPGFDTPQMVYVQTPHELDYYANNRWVDSPARMLGPLLARALEESGSFRAVVQSPTMVPADVRLVSELIRLQQNFTTRPSRVELSLRVQLLDVRTKRVLETKTFDVTETAGSDDAYGGVAAANLALQRVLTQVAEFCIAESSGVRRTSGVSTP